MALDPDARALLGSRLLAARRAAGLTRRELAEQLGSSSEAVAQYERGQREPTLGRLLELARALGTTSSDLLDRVR